MPFQHSEYSHTLNTYEQEHLLQMIGNQTLSLSCSHELACPGPMQHDQHKHLKTQQT